MKTDLFLRAAPAAAVLALAAGCATVRPLPPPPGPKAEILDVHHHIAGLGVGSDCWVSERFKSSLTYKGAMSGFEVNEETARKNGDFWVASKYAAILRESRYVSKALLMAMDGVIKEDGVTLDLDKMDWYQSNEFVRDVCRRNPDVFLYCCSINPLRKDAVERLRRCCADGAVAIKWLPNAMHFDPSDPRILPFYKECKRLGIPIITHTGAEHTASNCIQEYGNPAKLIPALDLGVTIVAAHCALTDTGNGTNDFDVFLRLMRQYPNLYGDTAGINGPGYGNTGAIPKLAAHPEIHDRILFATDMPSPNVYLISTPKWYWRNLTGHEIAELEKIKNRYDQDIMLKKTLGLPDKAFTGGFRIIRDPKAPLPPPEKGD